MQRKYFGFMKIKLSSVYSVMLVIVCSLVLLVRRYHCLEISPVDEKEHGNLDGLGRDIIQQSSKALSKIGDKLSETFSSDTKGLDNDKTLYGGDKENWMSNILKTYPGTKWCGSGNISDSFEDLGIFYKADGCCRDHDHCPDTIASDSSKYGLMNTGLFTRSHCDCDRKFYECLKEADTFLSKSIGYTYFTILGPQCFRQDHPIVDCVEEEGGRCEKYETDPNGEKLYQWFDNPVY